VSIKKLIFGTRKYGDAKYPKNGPLICDISGFLWLTPALPYGKLELLKKATVCPDLSKVFDNIFSKKGGNIMNTNLKNPEPMSEDQLEYIKNKLTLHICFLSATPNMIQRWSRS
jgi:hypothetical protein